MFMVIKTRPGFKRIVKHFCSDVNVIVKLVKLKSTNGGNDEVKVSGIYKVIWKQVFVSLFLSSPCWQVVFNWEECWISQSVLQLIFLAALIWERHLQITAWSSCSPWMNSQDWSNWAHSTHLSGAALQNRLLLLEIVAQDSQGWACGLLLYARTPVPSSSQSLLFWLGSSPGPWFSTFLSVGFVSDSLASLLTPPPEGGQGNRELGTPVSLALVTQSLQSWVWWAKWYAAG